MGYTVQYISTDSDDVFESIRLGNVHIEVEVWESSHHTSFSTAYSKGGIDDMGNHDSGSREDWWVTNFTIEKCNGLPDWESLNSCAGLFVK